MACKEEVVLYKVWKSEAQGCANDVAITLRDLGRIKASYIYKYINHLRDHEL